MRHEREQLLGETVSISKEGSHSPACSNFTLLLLPLLRRSSAERPEQMEASETMRWRKKRGVSEGLFYTFMGMSKQKRVKLISLLLPQSTTQQHDMYTVCILFMNVRAHNIISLSKLSAQYIKFGLTVKSERARLGCCWIICRCALFRPPLPPQYKFCVADGPYHSGL